MEAYGTKLGRLHCDLEHRDFSECLTNDKQVCLNQPVTVLNCSFFSEEAI